MIKKEVNDFESFLISSPVIPNDQLETRLMKQVAADLNPSAITVFSKLMGIHLLSALLTLSVCPQFGFRIFGRGLGLMHFFMQLGQYGCLIACGAFFTGVSLLIAGLVLRGEELRKIRQYRILNLLALVLLSLGFFVMIDFQFIFLISTTWFLGAMLGSLGFLELTWRVRFQKNIFSIA